jgi:hypothetical protein
MRTLSAILASCGLAVADLSAQRPLGAVLGTFATPNAAGTVPIGLGPDLAGGLLFTAIGPADEVHVMDILGTSQARFTPAQTDDPLGITTDGQLLFVTDSVAAEVDVYDPTGSYRWSFPVDTLFPEGIAFDAATQHLYVVDGTSNALVWEYDRSGGLHGSHPVNGSSLDGIACDPVACGYWVYDSGSDLVRHYDRAFAEVESFAGPRAAGFGPGEGVAVIGTTLYVVASTSGVVLAFDVTQATTVCNRAASRPYGRGCPRSAAIYEPFAPTALDLSGLSLEFVPNGSGGYSIASCAASCFETGFTTNLNLADDGIAAGLPLGFTFQHSGGSTPTIDVCANGYVWLSPSLDGDHTPTVGELLSQQPRIAACWTDFNPATGGGVYFDAFPGRAVVTWDQVPEYPRAGASTLQLQLWSDGRFLLSWQVLTVAANPALAGYSPGNGVVDSGAIDLSMAVGFSNGHPGTPLGLATAPGIRPAIGQPFWWALTAVPANATGGVVLVGTAASAVPLHALGMPNCTLLTNANLVAPVAGIAAPLGAASLTIPNVAGLFGMSVYSQAAVVAPGASLLPVLMSNGVELRLGD